MRDRQKLIDDQLARFPRPTNGDREAVARAVDQQMAVMGAKRTTDAEYHTLIEQWTKAEDDVLQRLVDAVARSPSHDDE